MFGNQNMATQLLPGVQQNLFCPWNWHTNWCHYGYHSCAYVYYSGCGWGYYSCHFGHYSLTPVIDVACPANTAVGPVGCLVSADPRGGLGGHLGDPVQALQVLRQQLEVALAGVQAQEQKLRELRQQEEGQRGRGGRGAGGPRSE